jgi:hypothetical protein
MSGIFGITCGVLLSSQRVPSPNSVGILYDEYYNEDKLHLISTQSLIGIDFALAFMGRPRRPTGHAAHRGTQMGREQ